MKTQQLWGARFTKPMSKELFQLSQSTGFDWRLAPYDLLQTMAHAQGLLEEKIITQAQFKKLNLALNGMLKDLKKGKLIPALVDEDVHSALERILIERSPQVGPWVRAGRSRNDQISCDLRMYLRDEVREISRLVIDLATELISLGQKHATDPMPGYTHTQRAQPVTLGHLLLSHVHALFRDLDRLQNWDERAAVSPLGAGALAGSGIVKQTRMTASLLAFEDFSLNSIDAVSERDFVAELAFDLALCGVHLSKLAEEIILLSTSEFGFAKLDDAWSTGSSMMPQKKNADGAELTRGKSARLIGNTTAVLTLLKSLPFAYNRDLQEDKEPIFDSVDTMKQILPVMQGVVSTLQFDLAKLSEQASGGFSLATEIADYLTRKGMDFKSAHEITGKCVKLAEEANLELAQLSLKQLNSVSKAFASDVYDWLNVAGSLKNRNSAAGTSSTSIKNQIKSLQKERQSYASWANEIVFRKLEDA
ncbi:MAG: argininosuccinate lyase [Candidatus Nanopelagicales bacterium]